MTHQRTVRLVLAVSLDGRLAYPQGGASQLGGPGDRRALEEGLAWSDAALIGAGTLRAHRSSCLIHAHDLLEQRQAACRSPQPDLFVVSRQADFPQDWPLFQQPFARYLLTPEGGGAEGFLDGHPLAASWAETLTSLAARGWSRFVLLGGAGLCTSMLADDAVDELQLTLCPRVLGGPFCWVPPLAPGLPEDLAAADAWLLEHSKPLGGGELLVRYRRNRSIKSSRGRS